MADKEQERVAATIATQDRPEDDGAADAQWLRDNPKVAAELAELVRAELVALFSPEVAKVIQAAKDSPVDRTKVLASLHGRMPGMTGGRPKMDTVQQAEWLRCAVARMMGAPNPELMEPDPELDVGGILTQALGPALGSKGGYAIPADFREEIEKRVAQPALIWPLLTKFPTQRESVTQSTVTAYPAANEGSSANSASTTSSDDVTETEPTLSELTWTMRYFDARMLVKLDQLEDTPGNLYEQLMQLITDAFVAKRESLPITGAGSGSSLPEGILEKSGVSTYAVGSAMTMAKALAFYKELPVRWRRGGSRVAMLFTSDAYFDLVSDLASNVHSAQFLAGELPTRIECPDMTDGKAIVGDFSRYVVYYNTLMRVVTETVARKFSMDIVVVEKWDGFVTIADAFRIATGITY